MCTIVPLGMFSKDGDNLCPSRGTASELKSINVCVHTDSSVDKPKECFKMISSKRYNVELGHRVVDFSVGNTEEHILDHEDDINIGLCRNEAGTCCIMVVKLEQDMCSCTQVDQLLLKTEIDADIW